MQRKQQNEFRRAGEAPSVLSAGRDPAQNNLNKSQTTQKNTSHRRLQWVATAGGDPMQSNQQNSGVP